MTENMNYEQALRIVLDRARYDEKLKYKRKDDVELERIGAKMLKRTLLGFCGRRSIRKIEEIIAALGDSEFIASRKQGRQFLHALDGRYVLYGNHKLNFKQLRGNNYLIEVTRVPLGFNSQ